MSEFKSAYQEIKAYIGEGELGLGIQTLVKYEHGDQRVQKVVSGFKGEWEELRAKELLGELTYETFEVHKNKLRRRVLDLLEAINNGKLEEFFHKSKEETTLEKIQKYVWNIRILLVVMFLFFLFYIFKTDIRYFFSSPRNPFPQSYFAKDKIETTVYTTPMEYCSKKGHRISWHRIDFITPNEAVIFRYFYYTDKPFKIEQDTVPYTEKDGKIAIDYDEENRLKLIRENTSISFDAEHPDNPSDIYRAIYRKATQQELQTYNGDLMKEDKAKLANNQNDKELVNERKRILGLRKDKIRRKSNDDGGFFDRDRYYFLFYIQNKGDKKIDKFQGYVCVTHKTTGYLKQFLIIFDANSSRGFDKIYKPLRKGSTIEEFSLLRYNDFNKVDNLFLKAPKDEFIFEWYPTNIKFSDGKVM